MGHAGAHLSSVRVIHRLLVIQLYRLSIEIDSFWPVVSSKGLVTIVLKQFGLLSGGGHGEGSGMSVELSKRSSQQVTRRSQVIQRRIALQSSEMEICCEIGQFKVMDKPGLGSRTLSEIVATKDLIAIGLL